MNELSYVYYMKHDNIETAYFASGCFWGTQYHFDRVKGVIATYVGFMGGSVEDPTYEQVKTGETGHVETVMVMFDSAKVSYIELLRLFFETHNFSQVGGQGPDIGSQYRSVIFYCDIEQKSWSEEIIDILNLKGHVVETALEPASVFWFAEDYHQHYYDNTGGTPYCHIYHKIF